MVSKRYSDMVLSGEYGWRLNESGDVTHGAEAGMIRYHEEMAK